MFVHICQHQTDVGGQQVIHLVSQRRLAEQLGAPDQVADGHVEVSVATGPVGDAGEWMSYQDVLQKEKNVRGSYQAQVIRAVVLEE